MFHFRDPDDGSGIHRSMMPEDRCAKASAVSPDQPPARSPTDWIRVRVALAGALIVAGCSDAVAAAF